MSRLTMTPRALSRRLMLGLATTFVAFAMTTATTTLAQAAGKTIKIGVIYDYTGPLAGGGSDLQALGANEPSLLAILLIVPLVIGLLFAGWQEYH